MAKINIPNIRGGFNLSKINEAFDTIETHLNDKVLYRDNPSGEPNQMKSDLDMNAKRVYNLPEPTLEHEPVRKKDIDELKSNIDIRRTLRVEDRSIDSLPAAPFRRNRFLSFDAQGNPQVSTVTDSVPVLGEKIKFTVPEFNTKLDLLNVEDTFPDGQWFTVREDESQQGWTSRYEKVGSVLVFRGFIGTADTTRYLAQGINVKLRTVQDKLDEARNIDDYLGATVNERLTNMATDVGYIRFPRGGHNITEMTIDFPMFFDPGSYLVVEAGSTVQITNTINSGDQWIFRGDGLVRIPVPDIDSGEDCRKLKAIWFGAFTQTPEDQAPAIQRAIDALGNSREGVVELDCGSYEIMSPMGLNRGVRITGVGTRRTVLQVHTDGYPVFETRHTACFIDNLQFENVPTTTTRDSPYIHLKHDFCEVTNIFHQSAKHAIIVDGPSCKITNVEAVYSSAMPSSPSAQVLIRSTSVSVQGIYARYSSGAWPDVAVQVGDNTSTVSITAFDIQDVQYIGGSVGVKILAVNRAIARGLIRGVNARGVSGVQRAVVEMETQGTGSIFSIDVSGLICPNTASGCVRILQNSSNFIRRITLDGVNDAASSGTCIDLIQTNGVIDNIFIGSNISTSRGIDVNSQQVDVGGITAVRVAIEGRRKGVTSDYSVPPTGVDHNQTYHVQSATPITITLPNNISGSCVFKAGLSSNGAVHVLQAESGATINGLASINLVANRYYVLTATRNTTGTNAQWYTN